MGMEARAGGGGVGEEGAKLQAKGRLLLMQQLVGSSWSLFPKFILWKKFPRTLGQNTDFQNLLAIWIWTFKEGPQMILGHIKVQNQFCRDYGYDYKGSEERGAGIARLERKSQISQARVTPAETTLRGRANWTHLQ